MFHNKGFISIQSIGTVSKKELYFSNFETIYDNYINYSCTLCINKSTVNTVFLIFQFFFILILN